MDRDKEKAEVQPSLEEFIDPEAASQIENVNAVSGLADELLDVDDGPLGFLFLGKSRKFVWPPEIGEFEVGHDSFAVPEDLTELNEELRETVKNSLHSEEMIRFKDELRKLVNGQQHAVSLELALRGPSNLPIHYDVHLFALEPGQEGKPATIAGWYQYINKGHRFEQELLDLTSCIYDFLHTVIRKGIDLSGLLHPRNVFIPDSSVLDDARLCLCAFALAGEELAGPNQSTHFFVKDRSMRYAYVSPEVAALHGHAPSEMLGRTDCELFYAPEEMEAKVWESLLKGEMRTSSCARQLDNGHQYTFVRLLPISIDPSHDVLVILGIVTSFDNEESLIRFQTAASSIPGLSEEDEIIAKSDLTILLTGESGTGKTYLARKIHEISSRAGGPFVRVDCGAIADELFEAELFGREKGAYTGAVNARVGLLRQGERGTLFLDEIGEVPLRLQPKLLGFLQDKTFTRVGGTRLETVNARIIAATNQDLEQAVEEGRFREDLYYRINHYRIEVPALRERPDELPLIANEILKDLVKELAITEAHTIDEDEGEILKLYQWYGNKRELKNFLSAVLVLAQGKKLSIRERLIKKIDNSGDLKKAYCSIATSEHDWLVPVKWRTSHSDDDLLAAVHRSVIMQALERAKGNKTQAARLLGMSLSAFKSKLKTLGITGSK